jgi:hypothetical protein
MPPVWVVIASAATAVAAPVVAVLLRDRSADLRPIPVRTGRR